MNEEQTGDVKDEKKAEPLPVDPEERLDWDFDIGDRPPPLWRKKILVRFRTRVAEPMPYPDPDTE